MAELLTAVVELPQGKYHLCAYDHTQLQACVTAVKNNDPFLMAGVSLKGGPERKIVGINRTDPIRVRLSDTPGDHLWSDCEWVCAKEAS